MPQRIIIAINLLLTAIAANAQIYTAKNLVGRWEFTQNKKANVLFTSDSTGAWLQQDGFLFNRFKYTAGSQKPGDKYMEFKFTVEPERKHPKHVSAYIKFLNDSVMLLRVGWPIGKGADTSYQHASVLNKIKKPLPGNAPHLPTYKDLLGKWVTYFKKQEKSTGIRFIDSTRLIYTYTDGERLMKYKINFAQQPVPFDLSSGPLALHGYLGFESYDKLRVELFEPGKDRPDHFTVFGHNTILVRKKEGAIPEDVRIE